MFQKGDEAHVQAMGEMRAMMQSPDAMSQWMDEKEGEFNALPDAP